MAQEERGAARASRGGGLEDEASPARRRRGTKLGGGGPAEPPPQQQEQQQQQQQQQQQRRLRWLKPRLRRRQTPVRWEQQEQRQQEDARLLSSLSFPPLLRASDAATTDAASAGPPSPSPSASPPPLLLEQLALGAVGALTAAALAGLSALSQLGTEEAAAAAAAAAAAKRPTGDAEGDSLDDSSPVWRRTAAVSRSAGLGGFPLVLRPAAAPAAATTSTALSSSSSPSARRRPSPPQRLLAVGTRYWGSGGAWWDGRSLLNIKIYDFALYAEETQARRALLGGSGPSNGGGAPAAASPAAGALLAEALAASRHVPATVLLRAARDVPLSRLADEYERILRRRVAAALASSAGGENGGESESESDSEPALRGLLAAFRDASRLPASAVRFGSGGNRGEPAVARGASLLFERLPGGRVLTRCIAPPPSRSAAAPSSASASTLASARVGDEDGGGDAVATLADVTCPVLSRALFGLYLGADQPVSQAAKEQAGESLARLLALPPLPLQAGRHRHPYASRRGDRVVCDELKVSPLDLHGAGQEHDACVLVPTFE